MRKTMLAAMLTLGFLSLPAQAQQCVDLATSRQYAGLELFRVARDHVQRRSADRTGCTKHGDIPLTTHRFFSDFVMTGVVDLTSPFCARWRNQ